MAIDLHEYKELYLSTANELLKQAQKLVKTLQSGAQDDATLSTMYRTVHSLKSQSLVMGYRHIGLANNALEALFKHAQEHSEILTHSILNEVMVLLSHVETALTDIENNHGEPDLSSYTKKMSQLISDIVLS